jgi:hypothetical protein
VARSRLLTGLPVSLDALNRPLSPAAARPAHPSLPSGLNPGTASGACPAGHRRSPATLRMSEKSVRRRIKAGVIRTAPTGGRLVRISSDELLRLAAGDPLGTS